MIRPATVDAATSTITVAVTVHYHPGWSVDGCRAAELVGRVQRTLAWALEADETIAAVEVHTYDGDSGRMIGRGTAPLPVS